MNSIIIICISALITCFLTIQEAIEKKSSRWKISIIVASAMITLYLGIYESVSKSKGEKRQMAYQTR
ncbi:MAG TPA: hypothetical protein VFV08_13795, partial [Puia sp.]|nr:hypothetical protein [Puia sp.]